MTRIELAYPKIAGSSSAPTVRCIAFEKYDGTNLHWVWDRELGWCGFGTRRSRFDLDERGIAEFHAEHPGLEEAPDLFQRDLAQPIAELFLSQSIGAAKQWIVFTEYFGPNSFAGLHKSNDPKQLVLLDVQSENGLVGPEPFVRDFAAFPIARVVYRGRLTGKFAQDVRDGRYGVAEGVVCKGLSSAGLWMVKIKTTAYQQRLQQAFQDNWEAYWE